MYILDQIKARPTSFETKSDTSHSDTSPPYHPYRVSSTLSACLHNRTLIFKAGVWRVECVLVVGDW
ncbi:hypothetical protein Hanom_Chr16g01428821 [Helianthus anomalus]